MKPLASILRKISSHILISCCAATLVLAQTNSEVPPVAQPPRVEDLPGKGPAQSPAWFQKTWATRRTQFWNDRQKDKGAVVFVGDSITQGWGTLEKDFPGVKVANRGISGDTTRGVLFRLKEDVLDLEPKAVVVLIGTNDIGLGADPEDVASNVKEILRAISKVNRKTPVIVCKIMPSTAALKRPADKIRKVNELVDDFVKGKKQFVRVDTWSIFADENGDAKKDEFPDLLHPNSAGYQKWADALKPAFQKLGLSKS